MFLFDNTEIVQRLKKYPIFNKFSTFTLRKFVAQAEIIDVPTDTVLFYSQTPSDCAYYIIDGCADLFTSPTFAKKVSTVRSGEMIGETSMITGESHGLTARTSRASHLLKINKDVFFKFFENDPELLMQLAQTMAKRLRRMLMGLASEHYPYKNIVLYNLSSNVSFEKIKPYFQECIQKDKTLIYDKHDFESSKQDIVPFLYQCENNSGVNIFFAEPNDTLWDNTVLLHAEYFYLIASENSADNLTAQLFDRISSRPCDLIIWHESPEPYTDTAQFYERHSFKRHHHVRDEKSHYQRLYRFMTGQAIGLIISAGGFRGYAHYGLVKALLEIGLPIDCIGGCSIGAAIGAGLAGNFNWEKFSAIYEKTIGNFKTKKSLNFTFPITSLLSGKLPTNLLRETFDDQRIEDLPINFFCIVGNLSLRQKEIKTRGKLWEWLRASLAVPGILPPLVKNGDVYVDGAVCTSLPVQDMRAYLDNAGKIISFDVRSPLKLHNRNKYFCPPILSFMEVLAYKLGFSKKNYVLPKMLDILLESSSIEQYMYDSEWSKKADIIIAPDTSSLSFSDPRIGDPLSLIAYTFAKEKLKEHQEIFTRWL